MNHKKTITMLLCFLLVMAVAVGCGNTQQPAETTGQTGETQGSPETTQGTGNTPTEGLTEPNSDETEPTAPPVQVVMPEYELTYSGTMADLITWEELQSESGLQFYVTISTGKTPIFTLYLNRIAGDRVEMKENGAGEQIPVTFVMEAVPENLSDADTVTFCMAQDIANDIAASLKLK